MDFSYQISHGEVAICVKGVECPHSASQQCLSIDKVSKFVIVGK